MAGAPIGNQNAAKGRLWNLAINKALRKRSKSEQLEELEAIADQLIDLAKSGDMQALKELGDRMDGKPTQTIAGTGEDGSIDMNVNVRFK